MRGGRGEQRVQVSEIKQGRDTVEEREREPERERLSGRIMGELDTERAGLKCQETVCGK